MKYISSSSSSCFFWALRNVFLKKISSVPSSVCTHFLNHLPKSDSKEIREGLKFNIQESRMGFFSLGAFGSQRCVASPRLAAQETRSGSPTGASQTSPARSPRNSSQGTIRVFLFAVLAQRGATVPSERDEGPPVAARANRLCIGVFAERGWVEVRHSGQVSAACLWSKTPRRALHLAVGITASAASLKNDRSAATSTGGCDVPSRSRRNALLNQGAAAVPSCHRWTSLRTAS